MFYQVSDQLNVRSVSLVIYFFIHINYVVQVQIRWRDGSNQSGLGVCQVNTIERRARKLKACEQ